MLDEHVYVIGSSLAEFGSRATTIYRVPTGAKLIEKLENWWSDKALTESLEEWFVRRTRGGDE
jgi:hypothetical protein